MKRIVPTLILAAAIVPAAAQQTETVTPDVVTIVDQDLVFPGETTELFLSGDFTTPSQLLGDAIDGLHRLEQPGQWLFSVGANAPTSLLGLVTGLPAPPGNFVAKGDVVLYDALDNGGAGSFRAYFCGLVAGSSISPARPNYDIDSLYLDGDELIVGFDVATHVISGTATTYGQADLARFKRTGSTCSSWQHMGPKFLAAGKVQEGAAIVGAAGAPDGSGIVLAFDVATCTCPPACPLSACPSPPTWKIQQLVKWSGTTFTQAAMLLPGWQESGAIVDGLSLQPPTCPGLGDANPAPGDVDLCSGGWRSADGQAHYRLEWRPTEGVDSYRVYRGRLSQPPLQNLECQTIGGLEDIQFVDTEMPVPHDGFYYLVAEVIDGVEGTLGTRSSGQQRVITSNPDCVP